MGDVPNACRIYRAVDVVILAITGLVGLGAAGAMWRLVTQIRTNQGKLAWPPRTGQQCRDFVLVFVVIIVVGEETMFRGWIQTQAGKRYGVWAGLLLSVVLFGLRHLPADLFYAQV